MNIVEGKIMIVTNLEVIIEGEVLPVVGECREV